MAAAIALATMLLQLGFVQDTAEHIRDTEQINSLAHMRKLIPFNLGTHLVTHMCRSICKRGGVGPGRDFFACSESLLNTACYIA